MNTQRVLTVTEDKEPRLLNAAFNQDQTCFCICHEGGFRVYNTDPMDLRMKRNFASSSGHCGIGLIAMLYRTNYVALVGGGRQPRFPINKLCIWDDLKKKPSIFLEFVSPVLNVLLSRIRIVVTLQNVVLVHAFESKPRLLSSYETCDNAIGVSDLSVNEQNSILAFPGRVMGQIQLVDISPENEGRNLVSIIKAHKAPIRCISLSNSGSMVASASDTGTLIRIHDTATCALLFEFRRGVDKATVESIKFSPDDTRLAVLSDKNTLHVFDVAGTKGNKSHLLSGLPLLPNYFKSTWAFASKDVDRHDGIKPDVGVLGWSDDDSVIILWKRIGVWEKYVIVEEARPDTGRLGKELVREGWRSFGEFN